MFELGAEVDDDCRIRYVPALRHSKECVWFGEDHYFGRAQDGLEPELSSLRSIVGTLDISTRLSDIPTSLQELVVALVGFIKVEAQFNPKKVGGNVIVGVIDRTTRSPFMIEV
jgi:hypothetical protein